jgi:ring-1,2-phenylacetyl-CoA epoxidase subunit PaaC
MSATSRLGATTSITVAETPAVLFTLRRADDALIAGHRLAEWCGRAPTPEEDIALANMGLDLLGQARSLYAHAAALEGAGHTEDDYAYLRDPPQYRNLLLLELPNGDFARTILRQFLYAAYADPWWRAMTASTDPVLAAIAAKAEKETAYHLRHSAEWVIRLGDGTTESHRRAQAALDLLHPYTGELFANDEADLVAAGMAPDPAGIRAEWNHTLAEVLAQATLACPGGTWSHGGGRVGRHTEHLGFLLAEMQHVARSHPGATW